MIDISGIKDGDIHLVKQKCSGNKEQENRNKTNKNNCLFEKVMSCASKSVCTFRYLVFQHVGPQHVRFRHVGLQHAECEKKKMDSTCQ